MQSIDGNVASSTNNDGPANAVVDNLLSEAKLTEYNATASVSTYCSVEAKISDSHS